jgi:hypothetical protein
MIWKPETLPLPRESFGRFLSMGSPIQLGNSERTVLTAGWDFQAGESIKKGIKNS